MSEVRENIIAQYARWTVLSALRSGALIKSRDDVYGVMRAVDFERLFDRDLGPIGGEEFNEWHEKSVSRLLRRDPRLTVGWGAKMLNVYLKTRCYIGRLGRHHLSEAIHPPIDSGLWLGLSEHFEGRRDILDRTHCVSRIKNIEDYPCYCRIIEGCRLAARELGCKLIEVEQLWVSQKAKRRRLSPSSRAAPVRSRARR